MEKKKSSRGIKKRWIFSFGKGMAGEVHFPPCSKTFHLVSRGDTSTGIMVQILKFLPCEKASLVCTWGKTKNNPNKSS
jgi:hypothetical protein